MHLKVCNFFFEEDYLASYPSLTNALTILDNSKIKTNFLGYIFDSSFPDYPSFKNVNYRLTRRHERICRTYQLSTGRSSYIVRIFEKICCRLNIKIYFIFEQNFLNLRNHFLVTKRIIYNIVLLYNNYPVIRNNYLICIDSNTLISSFLFKILFRKKFDIIFWSLEISTYSSIDLFENFLEKIELYALKNVVSIISQSEERLSLIKNFENIRTHNIESFFIPHSRLKPTYKNRKYFFNKKFKIDKDQAIILHLGWIHDVMDSYNLSYSTLEWESNYQLILHERMKRSLYDPYIKRLSDLKSNSLHLSLNPVPYNELCKLIQSCDIGLVIYNTSSYGSSWENIAKASGKLADYLAFGKPVICSNLPDLRKLTSDYNCGLCYNDLSEIPSLISKILNNYHYYSENALKCFDEEFDFSKSFAPFLEFISRAR